MWISRRGSHANHGKRTIELRHIQTSWDPNEKVIEIKSENIGDFSTDSTHDYVLKIRLDEIAKILNALGSDGVNKSSGAIEDQLESELKALNRIIAAASGLA